MVLIFFQHFPQTISTEMKKKYLHQV